MEDYSADKQKVKSKLADIDNEVTSKEEAWKKMAQLLKEGYALPLDYTVGVEQRKTRALLLENEVVVQTKEDDMKEFATPAVRRAIWTGAAKVWPKIAENDKDENDGEDNDDSDDKRSAKRRDCFMAREPLHGRHPRRRRSRHPRRENHPGAGPQHRGRAHRPE